MNINGLYIWFGIPIIFSCIFLTLKLMGLTTMKWIFVFAPIWFIIGIFSLIVTAVFIMEKDAPPHG